MLRSSALALLATSVLALPAHASDPAEPGYVLTVPPLIGTGIPLVITLEAPQDTPAILFASLDPGPSPTSFGTLCIGFPAVWTNTALIRANVVAESRCQIPCDPALAGLVSYWQFIALDPATRRVVLSNPQTMTVREELCEPQVLCPEDAPRDPAISPQGGGFTVRMFSQDYMLMGQGEFSEDPSSGVALLTGVVVNKNDPNDQWEMDVCFSDLVIPSEAGSVPPGSPKLELVPAAYVPTGSINPATWRYYLVTKGQLIGLADNDGCLIENITRVGPAFQVGDGASGKNADPGAAGWWVGRLSGPCGDRDVDGDFNFNLEECPPDDPVN